MDDGGDPCHAGAAWSPQAEVRLRHLFARQFAARALEHEPPLEHAGDAVGDRSSRGRGPARRARWSSQPRSGRLSSDRRLRRRRVRAPETPRREAAAAGSSSAHDRWRSPAARRPRGSRRACAATAAMRGNASKTASTDQRPPRPDAPATRRFSSTVRFGNRRRPSGTRAIPALTRRCAAVAVMSRPSNTIRPAAGRCAPAIARSSVDLPAPLAPTSASVSPSASSNDTSRTACRSPWRTSSSLT